MRLKMYRNFNYDLAQARYRILENCKNNKYYIADIKKLIEIEAKYKKIYEFLESEKALLTSDQYNNIYKYYNQIRESIKNKVKEIETKKAKEIIKNYEFIKAERERHQTI